MPETFWEPELSDQNRESQPQNPLTEAAALTVSAVDVSALEERIVRAVEMVSTSGRRASQAEDKGRPRRIRIFHEQLPKLEAAAEEINSPLAERDQFGSALSACLSSLSIGTSSVPF